MLVVLLFKKKDVIKDILISTYIYNQPKVNVELDIQI
jgi:hypothetical protein